MIEQDQIVAIAPCTKVKAPAGSLIVDGRGKFLIPGLWDMHVHGFSAEPGSRGRIVGNPEVIRKLAPGNRSDGFRSCLTRSAPSSVARRDNCRPTQTKQEHEGSIGKSEYVNQGELNGTLG